MEAILSLTILMAVATVTPGPNNLVVMSEAAEHGLFRALPAMAVIAAASMAMVLLAYSISTFPLLERSLPMLSLAGATLLAGMAAGQWQRAKSVERNMASGLRGLPLALFQLANPKAWIVVLFVAASARTAQLSGWVAPVLLLAISLASSLVWGIFGQALSRLLMHSRHGVAVRRALAVALFATAIDLALPQLGAIL